MDRKRRMSPEKPETQPSIEERKFLINKRIRKDNNIEVSKLMELTPDARKFALRSHPNPLGYPLEYLEIYNREKSRRDLRGFENLKDITREQIFDRGPEQVGPTRIQQVTNPNCIKSRFNNRLELENIIFPENLTRKFLDIGVVLLGDFDEYFEYCCGTDLTFLAEDAKIDEFEYIEIEKLGPQPQKFINSDSDSELDYRPASKIDPEEYSPDFREFYAKKLDILDITLAERHRVKQIFSDMIRERYDELKKVALNKFRAILAILNDAFGEYKDYVCVAGGFALSMYIYENYGYFVDFNDIDVFIHSCDDDTANLIAQRLGAITGSDVYQNDNVVLSFLQVENDDHLYIDGSDRMSIQIIKRLYTCPQQIITGFDVDCCCILTTLDGQIFTTERGYHAIKHGYNVVNFERLSPSYEYRKAKYNLRGFGIWIPHIEHFKYNAVFDANVLDYTKGSTIIMTSLMKKTRLGKSTLNTKAEISDYRNYDVKSERLVDGDVIIFKTLNPGEQTINTFHRIVLEDPKEWYPLRPEGVLDHIDLNKTGDETVEIDHTADSHYIIAMNVQRTAKKHRQTLRSRVCSAKILDCIAQLWPNSYVLGGIPQTVITGESSINLKIWDTNIYTSDQIKMFHYKMWTWRCLSMIESVLKSDFPDLVIPDYSVLGRIVFSDVFDGVETLTEEQSYNNFKKDERKTLTHFYSYGKNKLMFDKKRANVFYIANPEFFSLFEAINTKQIESCKDKINESYSDFIEGKFTYFSGIIGSMLLGSRDREFRKSRYGVSSNEYSTEDERRQFLAEHENDIFVKFRDVVSLEYYSPNIYLNIEVLDPSIPLETHISNSHTIIDDVIFCNGKYFGNKYNYDKLRTGTLNNKHTCIFDSPVWEQYIPAQK